MLAVAVRKDDARAMQREIREGIWNVKCGMWNVECEMWNVK